MISKINPAFDGYLPQIIIIVYRFVKELSVANYIYLGKFWSGANWVNRKPFADSYLLIAIISFIISFSFTCSSYHFSILTNVLSFQNFHMYTVVYMVRW